MYTQKDKVALKTRRKAPILSTRFFKKLYKCLYPSDMEEHYERQENDRRGALTVLITLMGMTILFLVVMAAVELSVR